MATFERIFAAVVHASWQAGVIAILVMLTLLVAGRWIPARGKCALWMLVAVRLVMPVGPGTSWSVFNLMRAGDVAQTIAKSASEGQIIDNGLRVKVVYGEVPGVAPARVEVVENVKATLESPLPQPFHPPRVRENPGGSKSKSAAAIGWCLVGLALLARLIVRAILFSRRVRDFARVDDEKLLELLGECRQRMNVRTQVDLRWADELVGPALMGVFAPKILLPRAIVERLDEREIRFIFLHELAHLKRRDILVDCAIALLLIVHWFNPLAWYAMHRRRAERELVCDAQVLSLCGRGQRRRYGGAIVKLIEKLGPTRAPPVAVGIAENKTELTRRINMIAEIRKTSVGGSMLALVVVLLVGCVGLTDAAGDSSGKEKTAKTQAAAAATEPSKTPAPPLPDGFPPGAIPQSAAPAATDTAVAAALDKKLPELKFDAVGFDDVVQFLRDISGVNIFVNWRALEAAGIDRNAPVTANLRDIRFSKALKTILADVGGGTVKLGYANDEGVITITTLGDLSANVITRVYDVRHLVAAAPEEFYSKPEAATTRAAQQTREQIVKTLITLIEETVAADSWKGAGGTIGSIQELQGQLIVTQTPENQGQIIALIDQLSEARGLQLKVEARFLSLAESSIATLPEALQKKIAGSLAANAKPEDTDKAAFLNADELTILLKTSQSSIETSLLTAPRLTLFSGQHAFVSVGHQTAYVKDYTMTKTAGGDTRWEPRTGTVESGLVFDVQGTLTQDRKSVTLALHPTCTTLIGLEESPYAGAAGEKLIVQRPKVIVSELSSTVTVAQGQTVMLSGLSSDVLGTAEAPGGREAAVKGKLLLLVNATPIIARETQGSLPMLSTKAPATRSGL